MEDGVFSILACGLIAAALAIGWRALTRERNYLAALNRYVLLKYRLGHRVKLEPLPKAVVDDITRIESMDEPASRQTVLDGIWKRAVRLEGSVDFWSDLLQKLGLLGTVLGLGFALAARSGDVGSLLEPLSVAVWTTVIGLMGSIAVSWRFGRDIDVEVDTCEENLRVWQRALERLGSEASPSAAESAAGGGAAGSVAGGEAVDVATDGEGRSQA
ncbi:MAG: hypothetical protein Tsb0020_55800 [Haliangiales bacterium]